MIKKLVLAAALVISGSAIADDVRFEGDDSIRRILDPQTKDCISLLSSKIILENLGERPTNLDVVITGLERKLKYDYPEMITITDVTFRIAGERGKASCVANVMGAAMATLDMGTRMFDWDTETYWKRIDQ